MQLVLIISAILFVGFIVTFFDRRRQMKVLREKLTRNYGQKPDKKKMDLEEIKIYWDDSHDKFDQDEVIDDVTWNDLDMDDVFKRINSCNCFVGEQALYVMLHRLPKDQASMAELEKQIQHFDSVDSKRLNAQTILSQLGTNTTAYHLPRYLSKIEDYKLKSIWLYRAMQVLLLLSPLPAIIFSDPKLFLLPGIIYVINLGIYAVQKYKYESDIDSLSNLLSVVNTASNLTKIDHLDSLEAIDRLKKIVPKFKKLGYMVAFFVQKKDASISGDFFSIIFEYLVGGTLIDFTNYDRVISIMMNNRDDYNELYHLVGQIDLSIAVASFRRSLPHYCTPVFTENKEISMTDIFHPLIDKPVFNSQNLDQNCLITGSNASGKSTYIKAIAVNVLLAHCIHTCMAKAFHLPPALLITSMAVRDELMEGESYYIKEIKYLNRIISHLNEDRMIICMIDEILRGTNTEERIAASTAILRYIVGKNCLAVVASHDIELTELLKADYQNYHFREKLHAKDVAFDYKLYEGASVSKNAIKLLEYVGFPQEIIINAREMI